LAAQAASSAADSAMWTRSAHVLKVIAMIAKSSGDSTPRVTRIIFAGI
jgi:hypothetical protein